MPPRYCNLSVVVRAARAGAVMWATKYKPGWAGLGGQPRPGWHGTRGRQRGNDRMIAAASGLAAAAACLGWAGLAVCVIPGYVTQLQQR